MTLDPLFALGLGEIGHTTNLLGSQAPVVRCRSPRSTCACSSPELCEDRRNRAQRSVEHFGAGHGQTQERFTSLRIAMDQGQPAAGGSGRRFRWRPAGARRGRQLLQNRQTRRQQTGPGVGRRR